MKPLNPLLALLTIALLGGGCAATAPSPGGEWVEVLDGTTRVTCHGADLEGPMGPRLARSDVYVSPDGSRRAWVEVEARAQRGKADRRMTPELAEGDPQPG